VSIDSGIGSVGASGTTVVAPASTTTYTLTAQSPGGVVTKQATVTVVPLPTATLTVTPSIAAGQPATLSWSAVNATSVSIDRGIGVVAASGSKTMTPSTSTTWVLTASNAVGSAAASATVTVTAPPPPPASQTTSVVPSPPSSTAGPSAQFLRKDALTQGIWRGVYGSDGYSIAQDGAALPPYAQVSLSGAGNWVWASSTSDLRALQRANGNGQIAGQWFGAGTTFTMDVTFIDAKSHPVALYLVDWDSPYRAQTVEVIDPATSKVLDSRSVSNFRNGVYLVWQIAGKVRFRLTNTGGANATVSGIFFGTGAGSAPAAGAARFVRTDTTTQGNWKGRYGADGYSIAQEATSLPAYAQVSRIGTSDWVWSASPSDARSLQRAGGSNRIAATWYAESVSFVDVTIGDGQSHAVSLYLLDYDSPYRTETIEVIDLTTGTVVDTRSASSFTNGAYYTWQVSGKVRFKITRTGGANATVSAIFFGAP
jgi:hypothetical protein